MKPAPNVPSEAIRLPNSVVVRPPGPEGKNAWPIATEKNA